MSRDPINPIRRVLWTSGVLLSCLLFAYSSLAGADLLRNGDFMTSPLPDDPVPGWTPNAHLRLQHFGIEPGAGRAGTPALVLRPMLATGGSAILSQRVAVEPDRSYLLLAWARMDDPVIGPGFSVNRQRYAILQHWARSTDWQLAVVPFRSGSSTEAEVRIDIPARGERRFTIGAALYVDSIQLLALESDTPPRLAGKRAAMIEGTLDLAPGLYYVWARVHQPERSAYTLQLGEVERHFRGYTVGETYWLRPILPELFVPGGETAVRLEAGYGGAAIEELILTRDQFWKPEGADAFLTLEEVQQRWDDRGFTPVEKGTVALRVTGATPPGEEAWPLTQGLPFPRGTLASDCQIRRADHKPLQTETLTRWPDGSVQWVLLNTLGRSGETITLEYGQSVDAPHTPTALTVSTNAGAIRVDTGVLQFTVPLDGSALLQDIETASSRIARVDSTVDGRFTSRHDGVRVQVEEDGPLRATLLLSGDYLDSGGEQRLSFCLRVTAFAGRAWLELEPVFLLTEDVLSYDLQEVALRFERPADTARLYAGPDPVTRPLGKQDGALLWRAGIRSAQSETNDFPYELRQGADWRLRGVEARGRFSIDGSAGPLAVHIEDFWQNAPKQVRLEHDHFVLGLLDGPLTFYNGMSKTHRVLLDFEGDRDWLDLSTSRPLLLAEPAWYGRSLALTTHLSQADPEHYPLTERSLAESLDMEVRRQNADIRVPGFGGLLHFGDRIYSRGPPPQGLNLETALGQSALLQLLRTGDRDRYMVFLDRAIRHFLDIDMDHSRSSGGGIFIHGPHTRDRLDPGSRTHGHSWIDGTYHYGLLMGWRRVFDTLPAVGAHYAAQQHSFDSLLQYWRSLAWKTKAVLHAYTHTPDPEWLAACRRDVQITAHQRDFLAGPPGAYQLALGLAALRHYEAHTADPAVRELYLQLVDTLLPERLRQPGATAAAIRQTGGGLSGRGANVLNELSWASRWTGDDLYLEYGMARLNRGLSFGVAGDASLAWAAADFFAAAAGRGLSETDITVPGEGRWWKPHADLPPARRPLLLFQFERVSAEPLDLVLFQTEGLMRSAALAAEVFDPNGHSVLTQRLPLDGRDLYRLHLPTGGAPGRYTVALKLEQYYRWTTTPLLLDLTGDLHILRSEVTALGGTLQHPVIEADPGELVLTLRPRSGNGRARMDELLITPWDVVPYREDPLPDTALRINLAALDVPGDWQVVPDEESDFGAAVSYPGRGLHLGGNPTPLRVPVDLPRGRYRLFLRAWHSVVENIEIAVEDRPGSMQSLSLRVFTMDGFRLDPRLGLAIIPQERAATIQTADIRLPAGVHKRLFGSEP